MGAGASSMQELDLGVTTLVLGQALAAITFPDMFRLHDFHSPKAPRLRSMVSITWFGGIQDLGSDEQDDDYETPPPEQYEHLFHVQLGDQMIYIDGEKGLLLVDCCCLICSSLSAHACSCLLSYRCVSTKCAGMDSSTCMLSFFQHHGCCIQGH